MRRRKKRKGTRKGITLKKKAPETGKIPAKPEEITKK